jgi:hypothetical protein
LTRQPKHGRIDLPTNKGAIMGRPRKYSGTDPFVRTDSFITLEGKTVSAGDIIKIRGIWGTKFRFFQHVTNPVTGVEWIDCVELEKGVGCGMRSFYSERVKIIPKKRGKRVNRSSKAS